MLLVVFGESRRCFTESAMKDVSQASPETIYYSFLAGRQPARVYPRPLVRARIFRVTSSSAARPSASVLSLDSVRQDIIRLIAQAVRMRAAIGLATSVQD